MEYSKKTRDKISKILNEEEEYPFKTLKNCDLKDFPKDETILPHQCGHCGVGMVEGYWTGEGFACSEHCMLSILYSQDAYYWTTWHDEAQQNIKDGEAVYDAVGNSYYLTEQFDKGEKYIGESSFEGGHHYD